MAKKRNKEDEEREERIEMEIVVDAHDSEERAMGWYYYIQESLIPFTATCTAQRGSSPLKKGDTVEVSDIADADDCRHEIFVLIRWDRKEGLAVPLAQLKPNDDTDQATRQTIEDWLYWARMGYEF